MRSKGSMKKFTTITLCLLVFGSGGPFFTTANSQTALRFSEPTEQLTLTQAVEIALQTNPSMKVTAAGRQLADAQLQEARTGRLPVLQAVETFTRSNNPVFVFGTLLEQGRFGPENFVIDSLNHPNAINNFRSALTLRLPLLDQRQTETRTARARIAQQEADQQTETAAQQLRFTVIRSFYGLLLAQARLEVSDEAVKTAEADVKRARDIFESGLVVQSDLLAAEVQLSEFRQQQIQAKGDLITALAALNTAMGLPVDSPQQPLGQLVERAFPTQTVETLLEQALQERPDYQRAVLSARASEIRSRGARGEWLPRVDAFVTADASGRYVAGGSGDYAAGASVTFNVFDAGRKARIDQSRAAEAIAIAEQEQLANQIRFEVMRAYQQYVSARERMAVVAQITAQATETLRMVQDRYHAGLTTITELLRAQTALVRARSDVLAARYDQYVGYANVLLAAGRLKDVGAFGS
jgi:outer membrane protein